MPAHLQDAIAYIITAINSDATLTSMGLNKAFMHSAPERQAFPYVIIQKQAGTHSQVMCRQAFATHFLAVKCVDTGFDGGKRARNIMDRVNALIEHQAPSLTDGGYTMAILANNSYEYDEQENGNNNFYHIVINYRVILGQ